MAPITPDSDGLPVCWVRCSVTGSATVAIGTTRTACGDGRSPGLSARSSTGGTVLTAGLRRATRFRAGRGDFGRRVAAWRLRGDVSVTFEPGAGGSCALRSPREEKERISATRTKAISPVLTAGPAGP